MARKQKEEIANDMDKDIDPAEARTYEIAFHIDPELPTEEAKKVYEAVRASVQAAGPIFAESTPKKIQLAYTISKSDTAGRRDFDTSFFAWIAYQAQGEGHDAVLTTVSEEARIFRSLDLRTTKEQAEHMAELEQIAATTASESTSDEEEEVSDAELSAALEEAAA